jgi:hypothetical protein
VSKQYFTGRWDFDYATGSIVHLKAGEYEVNQEITKECFDVVIPGMYFNELIQFMDEKYMIKPKMDSQSRADDLKIIHRLLDIQDKITGGKP